LTAFSRRAKQSWSAAAESVRTRADKGLKHRPTAFCLQARRTTLFKKILFATTASPTCDNAAKVGFDLARQHDAAFHVFHVFGIPTRGASRLVTDVRTGQEEAPDADYAAWVMEEMKNTYAAYLEGTPKAVIECLVGSPATEILRKAREEDVDLIVLGAHTQKKDVGAYRFRQIAGSTMQRVARGARCPVLIVNKPCDMSFVHFDNIVLGTDFSRAAMAAFMFACRMATHFGYRLNLFHAINPCETDSGQTPAQMNIEQRTAAARRCMEELYLPQMKGFDGCDIEVREGIPHVEILKFAREKRAGLIIIAHHSHEVDPQQALDSTFDKVVLGSACPVVTVNRPDKVQHRDASREKISAAAVHE
jgi:nucleotide-binding universal stress UspA family protein